MTISVSSSLETASNLQGNVRGALERSVALWQQTGDVNLVVVTSEAQNVSDKGARGDGISLLTAASSAENVRLFPKLADSPAAVTRVFSDARRNIVEADIALNPFVKFSTDGTFGTFDLQDTLTHEIGHLLGLRHSPIWGSIMYDKAATSFGPGSFGGARNFIPEMDAASIRSLYGPPADEFACCGYVSGRLLGLPSGNNSNLQTIVWVEDVETGRLLGAVEPTRSGSYRIDGLREGPYRLLVRSVDGNGGIATGEAAVTVEVAEGTKANLDLEYRDRPFIVDVIGSTPQLGKQAARIQFVRPQYLFFGGWGDPSQIAKVYRSGDRANLSGSGLATDSASEAVRVIGFGLPAAEGLESGEYSLVIEFVDGAKDYLVGALLTSGQTNPTRATVLE